MKRRTLMVMSLAILLAPGVLLSQEGARYDPNRTEIRIVYLKYLAARDACSILETLCAGDDTRIIMDENAHRLILRATDERMPQLLEIIAQLDVETLSAPQSEPLLCRVYMVEPPPRQSDLESFRIVLRAPLGAGFWDLLKAGEGAEFQIDAFSSRDAPSDTQQEIEIQGRAASNAIVKQVIGRIRDAEIVDIRWDSRTSTDSAPAAQVNQLPEQLRQHIHKFLGADVQTVGYWFGSLSSPGQVKAPIGPWSIELRIEPTQTVGLSVGVEVKQEWRDGTSMAILMNSIQGKVGKPIIIGYNRESYGARTMGAMIILLEPDRSP